MVSFPPDLRLLSPRLTLTGDPSASLDGVNTTILPDGAFCFVLENRREYALDKTSSASPDGINVIAPSAGPGRWRIVQTGGGGALGVGASSFSVNGAGVDGAFTDGSVVLRTGTAVNPPGAFNGGGTGNKAILGVAGFGGVPIGQLLSVSYTFTNADGPGGPFFLPPGGATVTTPYVNLIVDFDSLGVGDLRVLVLCDDSLNAAITASIGAYSNNGQNELTYSWTSAQNALIVLAPPNPVPGGVAPDVSVGGLWTENSYRWSDLVAANPDAILVDAFTGDGGLPAGAVTPSVMLVSGDSGNVVRSGKRVSAFSVNGASVL